MGWSDPLETQALNDLGDVNASSPQVGDTLTFDGTVWIASALLMSDSTPAELLAADDGSSWLYSG